MNIFLGPLIKFCVKATQNNDYRLLKLHPDPSIMFYQTIKLWSNELNQKSLRLV